MSGVEAAGLVLAVIPLIISGLEHYAQGAERIKLAWNYAREFKSLARDLETHNTCFRNSIKILLVDCVNIDDQDRLLDNLGGESWSDPHIADVLRLRLRDSYDPYVNTVNNIAEAVTSLQNRLKLDSNQVPLDDRTSLRRACKALYFALRRSSYMEQVKVIRDGTVVVERLYSQTQRLQAQNKIRRLPDFDKTRSDTTDIFESLQRGLRTTCSVPHRGDLYLNFDDADQHVHRTQRILDPQRSFRIILAHEVVFGKDRAPSWAMEETEVRLSDVGEAPVSLHQSAQSASNVTLPNLPWKPTIQFQDLPSAKSQPSNRSSTQQKQPVPPLAPKQLEEIDDICESIQTHRAMELGTCLGYVACTCTHHRHEIYWPDQRLLDESNTLSLADILQKSTKAGPRLRHAHAHRIAVSVASAVLRLHDTPWMPKPWNKGDILLMSRDGKVLSDRPYISRSLQAASSTGSSSATQPGILARSVIRNPTLFRLGILLIELCMGLPMHELHMPEDLDENGKVHELSDHHTASRLLDLEEIRDQFGKRWSEVVWHCIFCPKPSLQNIDLRRDIYTNVILELQEASRQFFDES